jgi:hypothetical protein
MLRSALSPSQIQERALAAFPESWRGILPLYPRDECGHEPFRHSQRDGRQGRGMPVPAQVASPKAFVARFLPTFKERHQIGEKRLALLIVEIVEDRIDVVAP